VGSKFPLVVTNKTPKLFPRFSNKNKYNVPGRGKNVIIIFSAYNILQEKNNFIGIKQLQKKRDECDMSWMIVVTFKGDRAWDETADRAG